MHVASPRCKSTIKERLAVKSPKLILANSLLDKPDIYTWLSLLPLPPDGDNIRLFLQPPSPVTIVHLLSEQVTKLLANGPSGEKAESKLQHALTILMWRSEILRRVRFLAARWFSSVIQTLL